MMQLIYSLVIFSLVLFQSSHCLTNTLWTSWKQQHQKSYTSETEEQLRREIWNSNYKLIEQHNNQNLSYTLALNHLADLTNNEFQKTYLAQPLDMEKWRAELNPSLHQPVLKDVPTSVDWRDSGYVSKVKNQGSCGSCWAFSATGALEAQYAKRKGSMVLLSEQELVDCSWRYGNVGCNGGLMDNAFMYVRDYGICSANSYSYVGYTWRCKSSSCTKVMKCKGYKDISSGDENSLTEATASIGPVSVAIDASSSSFQFYSSGVFYSSGCSSSRLNHGVLLVGYGTYNNGKDYWIVKNSWSSSWGKSGYILMSRNAGNNCGIATAASYPTVSS